MTTRNIPRAKELFWVGSTFHMLRDMPEFLLGLTQRYGPVVQFSTFGQPLILVAEPALVHEILVQKVERFPKSDRDVRILSKTLGTGLLISNGEVHRQRRTLVQPAFHVRRIQAYADCMLNYTDRMLATWHDGEQRNIADEMKQLTMFIVAKTLFDADAESMGNVVEEVEIAMQHLQKSANFEYKVGDFIPGWMPFLNKYKAKPARQGMNRVVDRIISQRRNIQHDSGAGLGVDPHPKNDRGDLLSMLLLARDEEGRGLDDLALRDEIITLFLAGHETTANALTWTLYLLSQHPEIEAHLHEEVDALPAGEPLDLDALRKLPYTLMVIKEAMRLYPPAWALTGRQATDDTKVGDYLIPKGAILLLSPYVLHHSAQYFPEPKRFDPMRFTPEREKTIPKYAYLPFGAGARICIGNHFAMMEAHLLLAAMTRSFRFALQPGYQPVPMAELTLTPRDGMPMRVMARHGVEPVSATLPIALPAAATT
jgi:cytochrome P450